MSYAGPASRGKRALEIANATPSASASGSGAAWANQSTSPAGASRSTRPGAYEYRGSLARRAGKSALFAAGLALGVVVGAGLALLLAPQSGEDTRHAIARRGRRITRRGHDAWDDLRDEFWRIARRRQRRRQRDRQRDSARAISDL